MARFLAFVALTAQFVASQPNIDGGRGDLPGMKQDMFDQVKKNKKGGPKASKGPPDCPKSPYGGMSPFTSMAFGTGEIFVRLDASDGPCHKLISIGGANHTLLQNASLTCGPVGEWKKRVAEEMSMVFFQGGLEWPKNENETIEVVIEEDGENRTVETTITEAKYAEMMECWKRSCGCEQANNPKMKIILFSLLLCAIGGLSYDSIKLGWESFRGSKPPKHVLCKKDHRVVEVNFAYSHICDICRKTGTGYQCSVTCNYDMCKLCYKAAKKKTRAKLKAWLEKHPEDVDNKSGTSKDDDEDDDAKKNDDGSQSEGGDKKDAKKESEAESGAESESKKDGSEAEKETTGDEKAKSEEKSEKSEEEEKEDKDNKDVQDS